MKILIKNGRVINPSTKCDKVSDVWIDGKKIISTGKKPTGFIPKKVIDATNQIVCPGFVDLGSYLQEPGYEHKATIVSEANAAAAGGFTSICCMPKTNPVIDTPAVVELIKEKARGIATPKIYCIGALTEGLKGQVLAEMSALREIGCVGVSNAREAIEDTAVLKNSLEYAASINLTVFMSCEDPWLAKGGSMHDGLVSTKKGLVGIPSSAELIALSKVLILVEQTGVKIHFQALSSGRSVKYITDARRKGLPVSCDVSISHISLCDQDISDYDPNYHIRPPLRSLKDKNALINGLKKGQVDAISPCHEPQDADSKASTFSSSEPGISSYDTFLSLLWTLVRNGQLTDRRAIELASCAPGEVLGKSGSGIVVDGMADICVFDPNLIWTTHPNNIISHGKNTPFLNREILGKVTHTIADGQIIYSSS
jgi:dihydroorotase